MSFGNLAAAQMMSGATTQAAAATSTDAGAASAASGVAVAVLAMELRAQRSLVDLFA
jgi:hypothetical protein